MTTSAIKRGQSFRCRRSGIIRTIDGFTTKPSDRARSDGIRRARLVTHDIDARQAETRVRVDQLTKSYQAV